MNLFWIDVETTGLDPRHNSIIEFFGFYKYSNGEKEEIHCFTRPYGNLIDHQALIINGHSEKYIRTYPDRKILIDELSNKLSTKKFTLSGWNPHFDYAFLKDFFQREEANFDLLFDYHLIDVFSIFMAKKLSGEIRTSAKTLSEVADYFQIHHISHDPKSDCITASLIFDILTSTTQKEEVC